MAAVRANAIRVKAPTAPKIGPSTMKPMAKKTVSPAMNMNRGVNRPPKTQVKPKLPPAKKELSLGYLRQKAVKGAWAQEKALVRARGGSHEWTKRQREELIRTGSVKGYVGHHIRSVNGHSKKWAGDPRNIKFVTRKRGHLREHKGHFKNKTTGKLIDRQKLLSATKNKASARTVKK